MGGWPVSGKYCDRHWTLLGKAGAMSFDAFDLVQGFSRHVTLSAMRARNDRNVLNDKEATTFAIVRVT